ncbi:MAG: hypothetical protein ACLSUW_02660 [Akkermansia sp.]
MSSVARRHAKPGDHPEIGETHAPDDLIRQFEEAGFEGVPQVISRGQWSRRGGILDVFPLQSSHPVRLIF